MPVKAKITKVRINVTTAPTGANIIVDIKESGTSIFSTLMSIDAGEETSKTATTSYVISDANIADDAKMTFDITQVGSTVKGVGLKATIYYLKQ